MARKDKSQRPGYSIDEDLDRENEELLRKDDDLDEESDFSRGMNEGSGSDHNQNVDKTKRMKERERDNIE